MMSFWNRKKHAVEEADLKSDKKDVVLEIVAEKTAQKHVADKAKEANAQLQQLLADNPFTIKVYLSMGGEYPPRNRRKK